MEPSDGVLADRSRDTPAVTCRKVWLVSCGLGRVNGAHPCIEDRLKAESSGKQSMVDSSSWCRTCSLTVQSAESATECVTAEGLKGVAFMEVHVVGDRDRAVTDFDQIE